MKYVLILCIFLFLVNNCLGFDTEKKPFKAAALSFFLPGGGQLYNESYLKFGIFAATECSIIGYAFYHYQKSEDYYDQFIATGDETYYNQYLDYYYKRQNDYWWLGVTIFLSTIDAYVDAHLYNYEKTKKKVRLKFEKSALLISYEF